MSRNRREKRTDCDSSARARKYEFTLLRILINRTILTTRRNNARFDHRDYLTANEHRANTERLHQYEVFLSLSLSLFLVKKDSGRVGRPFGKVTSAVNLEHAVNLAMQVNAGDRYSGDYVNPSSRYL